MGAFDKLYKREPASHKTYEINDGFYDKLQYLSRNVYAASVNQLVNEAIRGLLCTGEITLYAVKERESTSKRSFIIRNSLLDGLERLLDRYPSLSAGKMINIAVYMALAEEEENLRGYDGNGGPSA